MAKAYPPAQKQEALRLLEIHQGRVPIVHNLTAIPAPTLYRWRRESLSQEPNLSIQKNNPSIDNRFSAASSLGQPARAPQPDSPVQHSDRANEPEPPRPTAFSAGVQSLVTADNDAAAYAPREDLPDPDSEAAQWHKDNLLFQLGGVPGKSYPYPLETDEEIEGDFEDFRKVRNILMNHAHRLAANLRPDDPDINRRSLALSRILARITQLDEMLPDLNPEKVTRFEYVYDGMVHNVPAWSDPELKYMNRIKDLEKQLAEALAAQRADSSPPPSGSTRL